MIRKIELQNESLLQTIFSLQRSSYMIEAKLIDYFDIPPLMETVDDLKNCGETFIGYFDDEELEGSLSYSMNGLELTICRMIVDPKHFREGIAQKLLLALEEEHKEIEIIRVSTGKDNFPATKLYLKNGFEWVNNLEVAPGFFISQFEKRMK